MNRSAVFFGLIASSLVLVPSVARAQTADLATSEALFDEGKRLMEKGDYPEACPKLSASLRLDVGIGAMLYLAECYVHLGKTASAWGQFREAAAVAASRHDARERLARERATQLEPHLSRLTVSVPAGVSGVVIRRDAEVLDPAVWATAVPVDPGEHAVEATAPGKVPFRTTVTVEREGASATVSVPVLQDDAPRPEPLAPRAEGAAPPQVLEPPVPHRAPPPASPFPAQRIGALVAGGVGVVGLGLGTFWGISAKGSLDDSNAGHCHGNQCDAAGVDDRRVAQDQATLSTVAMAVGGAALVTGAVLWLTAPRARTQVAIAPSIAAHQQSLTVLGTF
ncbi:MAG TPA: hypothetical protein VGI39_03115, partial [Polyangiaceae bacterium]